MPIKTRYFTSKPFRDAILNLYPNLGNNLQRWRVLEYILKSDFLDADTGNLILSAEAIACHLEQENLLANKEFSTIKVLKDFSDNVFKLEWSEYYWSLSGSFNKPRQLLSPIPAELDIMNKMDIITRIKPRVRFDNGLQESEEEYMLKTPARIVQTDKILEYMNGLPRKRFVKAVDDNFDDAIAVWKTLSPKIQDAQLRQIDMIQGREKPIYKSVDNSTRVYSVNKSIATAKREIREAFCKGWQSMDLRSSQYTIVYHVWGMKKLGMAFYDDLWTYVLDDLGLTLADKPKIKTLLYSLIFGKSEDNLKQAIRDEFPDDSVDDTMVERFIACQPISDLLKARELALTAIKTNGYALDAWGEKLTPPDVDIKCKNGKTVSVPNYNSVLAQVAQSYETRIMYPVIDLAKETNGRLTICLWLHDGIKWTFDDKARIPIWEKRLSAAITREAEKLGIPIIVDFS